MNEHAENDLKRLERKDLNRRWIKKRPKRRVEPWPFNSHEDRAMAAQLRFLLKSVIRGYKCRCGDPIKRGQYITSRDSDPALLDHWSCGQRALLGRMSGRGDA